MLTPRLAVLVVLARACAGHIAVVKHWSTAVSQGNTAKLACKANHGAEIR